MKIFEAERKAVLDAADQVAALLVEVRVEMAKLSPEAQHALAQAEGRLAALRTTQAKLDAVLDTIGGIAAGLNDLPDWLKRDLDKAFAATGHFGEIGEKVNALIADFREGRLKLQTETKVVKT